MFAIDEAAITGDFSKASALGSGLRIFAGRGERTVLRANAIARRSFAANAQQSLRKYGFALRKYGFGHNYVIS